ncbi:hypothetical protein OHC33_006760 [Knufia fluminis]|uniref:Phospholipase C n=1 Tax=Knufia fluminis TaxID=191047 RepID=A0AAN8EJI0_9EURO|nr:hypothetical protein OHC33_006760 [Knufia fluminis]
MYYAEHRYLGDTVEFPKEVHAELNGRPATAALLKLENGLLVTYGEINGFGGDYFGLTKPISSEANEDKMKDMFQRWYDLLGYSPSGKAKAEALRAELKSLNDQAEKVMRSASGGTGDELAAVYQKIPLDISHLDSVSKDARWANGGSFLQLIDTNVDHFGNEARLVYNAGHALALDWAAKGDLKKAFAVNGFADHFLEDSFAAGHMRVPRGPIWEVSKRDGERSVIPGYSYLVNACSNVMHEEDGELGLWVESPSGEKWKAFGDGRLPGKDVTNNATSTTLDQVRKALQESVKEVHEVYKSKQVIQQSQFKAWRHAPIIDRISTNTDNHNSLVKVEAGKIFRRVNGLKSETYEETSELGTWLTFYGENYSRVANQIALKVRK